MAHIEALTQQVTRSKEVVESATLLINGIAGRIEAAVALALQNGATPTELAPLTAEINTLHASADALAAAVAANTPGG